VTRIARLALAVSLAVLAVHAVAWIAGAAVVVRTLHPPPIQSAVALAASALLLRITDVTAAGARRLAAVGVLVAFGVATVALPLAHEYAGNGFMGDGWDYSQDRDKFDRNAPVAAGHAEIHFKSHLGDLVLATVDRALGRTTTSPAAAYRFLSHLAGFLFIVELLVVLWLCRWSRRACRYAALALACPLALGFFAYYEVGYTAASIALFPLLLAGIANRERESSLDAAGAFQGLHTALHGFGLLGIAGGAAAAICARRRPLSTALRFGAFALATYLGWLLIYVVVLKLSIVSDPYSSNIAFRRLTAAYYFDRRLVQPFLSWPAFREIGATSLAIGVPLLAAGIVRHRGGLERSAALLCAAPGLLFLLVWWASAGVGHDMDLLWGAFAGIGAASWLAARTPRAAFQGWIVLALVHVALWAIIADRTMDRIWLLGHP
jgi:hypothetical protein